MEACHRESAEEARRSIERSLHDPSTFRAALVGVPPSDRDAWLDLVLGLGELPEDDPELPRGCVPYLPCSVDTLLRMVDRAAVSASDVFVDVGSGVGRAVAFVHLLTGATAVGLEIQPSLARASRELAARLSLSRVSCVEGDAAELAGLPALGSVFFLYCPFGGKRLAKVLDELEAMARAKTLRVCCVNLPLPPRPWLVLETLDGDLAVHRSTPHATALGANRREPDASPAS